VEQVPAGSYGPSGDGGDGDGGDGDGGDGDGGEDGGGPRSRSFSSGAVALGEVTVMDRALDTICRCKDVAAEDVQLQVSTVGTSGHSGSEQRVFRAAAIAATPRPDHRNRCPCCSCFLLLLLLLLPNIIRRLPFRCRRAHATGD